MTHRMLAIVALFALVSVAAAQPSTIGNYSVFQTWLPIIFIAILLSISIVAVYYLAGVLLNNSTVKASAISELGQAISTGIITVAVIGAFALVGGGQLSLVSLLSPSSVGTVCQQLSGASLTVLKSNGLFGSGNSAVPTTTNTVCSAITSLAGGSTGGDITPELDYGLFSTYVIAANLTNQAANNLNAFYVFSGWIGFLSTFTARSEVCAPVTCLLPEAEGVSVDIASNYTPLKGYSMITSIISSAQGEAVLTFDIMYMQLLITTVFLLIWPYLLAAGIILHSTFFTRKLGGLLMALALAAVLIFPLLYIMEYTAFNSLHLGPIGTSNFPTNTMALYEQPMSGNAIVYGANQVGGYVSVDTVQGSGCGSGQYVYENVCGYAGTKTTECVSSPLQQSICSSIAGANVNFFILPQADGVLRYFDCLPDASNGGLGGQEAAFTAFYLIPGFSLIGEAASGIGSLVGALPITPLNIYNGCTPDRAISAAIAITNMYGISFVAGILIPILNILVALAAMSGFATLFGGETDFVGLGGLI